jgi:transposase
MQMEQAEMPLNVSGMDGTRVLRTLPEEARLRKPVRNQVEMIMRDLDSLVPEDHPVRAIWEFLQRLDLAEFYRRIKVVLDSPGRPASDPRVLLALWVYATVEGIGSARRLDRLCEEHDIYRWLCGGVPVNYHTLADFRTAHQAALDKLLTEIVAALMKEKLVTLKQVAQDGIRVRAGAGASSFHRGESLEQCLRAAEAQVKRLAEEKDHPDPEVNQRKQAARERAARERSERVEAALRQLPKVQAAKKQQQRTKSKKLRGKITEARVSTTDPEARVMKMPDGGWRPAYNVEFATDVASGIIVGASVVNQGNDSGQGEIMETQVKERSGLHPEAYLVDGGFAQRDTITTLTRRQVTVYAPVRSPRTMTSGRNSQTPRSDDTPEVVAWRQRMETEEAKGIYRLRAATAEWANAQARHHGLTRFTVRGLTKALNVVLLVAIAHNLLRWLALVS